MTRIASSNPFRSARAVFWLVGVAVLVVGILVGAIVLPSYADTPGNVGPEIHVPSMQNIPSEEAPKLKLDVDKKP